MGYKWKHQKIIEGGRIIGNFYQKIVGDKIYTLFEGHNYKLKGIEMTDEKEKNLEKLASTVKELRELQKSTPEKKEEIGALQNSIIEFYEKIIPLR